MVAMDGGGSEAPSVLICLMRTDLRVHDNALWHFSHCSESQPGKAHNTTGRPISTNLSSRAKYLLPLYVFDERDIELSGLPGYERKGPEPRTSVFGFWRTGAYRTRFIAESVYDLRSRLREKGSDLCVRFGITEDVLSTMIKSFNESGISVEGVWMQKEATPDELKLQDSLAKTLNALNTPLSFVYGKTLIHPDDLPFNVSEVPDVFTPFRKRVEALGPAMVRKQLDPPEKFKPVPPSIPDTNNYRLDVSYEVDVDGLSTRQPESSPQSATQVSFYDILRYLLLPLSDINFPPSLEGNAILQQRHHASAFPLRGGESSALDRLDWYFVRGKSPDSARWGRDDPPPVARYKQTRNNLVGHAYSTKMSPFLAYGSVSARQIWEALETHEALFGENQNTYWVKFELMWRDYFCLVAEKFGDLLFHLGGFELATDPPQARKKLEPGYWKTWDGKKENADPELSRLLDGRTGIPFIDANIRELRESGFVSNRGRQNFASYLAHDLRYDWRIGAEFFQSYLIDYEVVANYGNWAYVAGVGNDPRASRRFNVIKQAKDYDSHGEYVKTWLPALRGLPVDFIHTPWLLDAEEKRRYGLKTSEETVTMDTYPGRPLTEDESWKKHYERKEGVGSRMHGNPQEKIKDGKLKAMKRPHNRPAAGSQSADGSDRRGSGSVFPSSLAHPRSGANRMSSKPASGANTPPIRSGTPPSRNGVLPSGAATTISGRRNGSEAQIGGKSLPDGKSFAGAAGQPVSINKDLVRSKAEEALSWRRQH